MNAFDKLKLAALEAQVTAKREADLAMAATDDRERFNHRVAADRALGSLEAYVEAMRTLTDSTSSALVIREPEVGSLRGLEEWCLRRATESAQEKKQLELKRARTSQIDSDIRFRLSMEIASLEAAHQAFTDCAVKAVRLLRGSE